MEITLKEDCSRGGVSGFCSEKISFGNGFSLAVKFGFLWDEKTGEFPFLSDGILEDSFGLVATFCRSCNSTDWKLQDKSYKNELPKILSDTLAVLKMNLSKREI